MAKDITLKTRNGETRYPKSVTALIFENATGKTLQTIIDEMRQVDAATNTRTQHFKADVNNLDTLKNKTDIGLYNYVGTGWRGSVSVCYDSADNVSQVALSSSTPSYNGNTLTWLSAQPCAMARTYTNGAWSHWEKVGAPVVNDLTTGGTDKALSAEMGKTLKEGLDALGPKIDNLEKQFDPVQNISDSDIINGGKGVINKSGQIVSSGYAGYGYTDLIEIGSTCLSIEASGLTNFTNGSNWFHGVAFYDENGDFISEGSIYGQTSVELGKTDIPSSARFVRFGRGSGLALSAKIEFESRISDIKSQIQEFVEQEVATLEGSIESVEDEVAELNSNVDAVSEAVLGKEEYTGNSSITSPNWTPKALSVTIPSGAVVTAISPTVSQFYLVDANGNDIIGALNPNLLPLTLPAAAVSFKCSPTDDTFTLTYKTAAVEGMQSAIDRIEGLANGNADEIESIRQQISGTASDYEIFSNKKLDSSFNVVDAANPYDRVVKIKCEGGTKYVLSTDYRVNPVMYDAEIAFFNADDELISGSIVDFKKSPAYKRELNGFTFETPANTSYVIASLSNVNSTGIAGVVYCDKYDDLNKTKGSNALSIWVLGDSISATGYQTSVYPFKTNATASYGVGGWISEFLVQVSRRPLKWFNYAHGGWFLAGEPVSGANSFSLELENAIADYNNETIDAPDIILSVGCTNDFDYTSHQVTDSDLQGESYNEYMERNFMTVVNDNTRTLIPIADVNKGKLAGAMRYIVERVGTLFPNCKFVFCTPSQSTLHNPVNQMRCVNEMKWMAARLCVPIIDVWCEAQMPMLWDYYDANGTQHHRFLDDRVHTYNTGGGSNAIGWQRQGQYIARRFSEIFRKEMGLDY